MSYQELKEKIINIINICKTKSDIVKNLDLKSGGVIYKKIDKIIIEENLNISHFIKTSKYGSKYKIIVKKCNKCNKDFETFDGGKKGKMFCSLKCANSKNHSDDVKSKISKSLKITNSFKDKKVKNKFDIICKYCDKIFTGHENRKFCSNICSGKYNGNLNGLKLVISQNKRSKNEIYFSELCSNYFKVVKTNEAMFNGWDADVIIEDIKVAVLWNGIWHYEKITEKHSVKQVQNRDRIKIEEIKKVGYTPYIIKDMGKYKPSFVKEEFEKFIIFIDKNR